MENMPQTIGRYRVERLLGSGSMGHVYLAHDADLDRPVAVKTLRDVQLDDETRAMFYSRFQNEAKAAARLQHPNIVQIFDVGDDPQQGPYLVFEYVPGHTLKRQLRQQGALPREEVLKVVQQVADALATAHIAGVIHRDLKPENLLVTENGLVKLADFGIARVPNADLTKEGQFLGTPCYAAPETLLKGEYSERTDLFSFGAVIYEIVCGERAFPGSEAMVVAQNVMYHDPIPPSEANRGADVPPPVDKVIMRALSKDPGDRYGDARTLATCLRDAYAGKAPRAPSRTMRRLSLVLLLTAGVVGAGWAVLGSERPASVTDTVADTVADTGTNAVADADTDVVADTAPDTVPDLSPHEREEAAKDQLARARRSIEEGDVTAANAALDRAAELDPSNPDIEALRSEIQSAEP